MGIAPTNNIKMYTYADKMADLMSAEPQVLRCIARFRLPVGVGDKTIGEVCLENNVHTPTFLAVVNYVCGRQKDAGTADTLSLPTLMDYLRQAHDYFFTFSLPLLRRNLIEAVNLSINDSKIPMLIIKYYDEYVNEVSLHMQHENEQLFPYIESLMRGEGYGDFDLDFFSHQHRAVDDQHIADKLRELKKLIIKYYPETQATEQLIAVLAHIAVIEQDLATHCAIEDDILLPAVRQEAQHAHKQHRHVAPTQEELSEREKDVLREIVQGKSNKEIADTLCISVHTVISHRKNITKKLSIHSPAGLTIYAISHSLVDIATLTE